MKKLLFTALIGLAMLGFTGCTNGADAAAESKCSASGKCAADKAASKCSASGKCSGDKAKKAASKCAASGKCGK